MVSFAEGAAVGRAPRSLTGYSSRLPPPAGCFATREVARLCQVTPRQLDYWVRRGLLHPAVEAQGSGSRRVWTPADLVAVAKLAARWELAAEAAASCGLKVAGRRCS